MTQIKRTHFVVIQIQDLVPILLPLDMRGFLPTKDVAQETIPESLQ